MIAGYGVRGYRTGTEGIAGGRLGTGSKGDKSLAGVAGCKSSEEGVKG